MVKQLLCINGDLKGFTNGQLYTIVPNELNPSFEKWVYNDNGQYIHIPSSLMGSYFKLVKEEESAAKTVNVDEMNMRILRESILSVIVVNYFRLLFFCNFKSQFKN